MGGALRSLCVIVVATLLACSSNSSKEGPLRDRDADDGSDAGRPGSTRDGGSNKPSERADSGAEGCSEDCRAPARCEDARCACPEGYADPEGDGSKCVDEDECEGEDVCDRHATCANRDGGFDCACNAPAYVGDGKQCDCAEGYTRDSDGFCLAENGKQCSDNLDCLNRHCVGGTCCSQRCADPGQCQDGERATCEDGKTCAYPAAEDGASCDDFKACTAESTCRDGGCISGARATDCDDDNPCTDDSCEEPAGCKNQNNSASCDDKDACTTGDVCKTGTCSGGARVDCAGSADLCNSGECDPANGSCRKLPRTTSVACDDGNTCTTQDQCTTGACAGSGNACGVNADNCTPGTPNTCTCKEGFVSQNGLCVPMSDECAGTTVCSPNADCFDPSNTPGDLSCTCKPGYTGNGTTCTASDPCASNPCGEGRGTCSVGANGVHTCSCSAGFVAVAGQCVCDLSGTFATRTRLEVKWENVSDQIEDGSEVTLSYGLEKHTYDADGNLSLEMSACGATSLDLCGLGVEPVLAAETYSQFLPIEIFGTPGMPVSRVSLRLPNALPGSDFVSEDVAVLQGISLTDPKGAWPSNYRQVTGTSDFDGSAENGAAFIDHDNDTYAGVTSYVVPPGGIRADGVAPDPISNYGAQSAVCPRMGGPHSPYAYWPAPPQGLSLTPIRIKRFYTASRVISAFKGKLDSCDRITGELVGPNNGKAQVDARIAGCVRTAGAGESGCPASVIEFLDNAPQTQQIVGATFTTKRMTGETTCAAVRATSFD